MFGAAILNGDQASERQQDHTLKQPAPLVSSLDSLQNEGLLVAVEHLSSHVVVGAISCGSMLNLILIGEPETINLDSFDSNRCTRLR